MNKIAREKAAQKLATNNKITNYSDYTYAFASTLNQMVNYIPWKQFGFKNVYALTISDNKEFDNTKWNKNLEEVIDNFEKVEIVQEKALSIVDIKTTLLKNVDLSKPIFWNVTGGQRPFLFAVNQIITNRPDDRICYLEGNTQRLIIMKPDGSTETVVDYAIDDDMTLEIALKLMGFDVSKDGKSRTEGFSMLKNHKDKAFFIKLTNEVCINDDLRLALIETNKPDKKQAAIVKLKNNFLTKFTADELKTLGEYLDKKATYPFGYILEYMAAFKILDNKEVIEKIADMSVSASLFFTDKEVQKASSKGGYSSIDEFDIAILTKTGQLIIIECKSGGMSGDVAKSTKYSTYAAAGVYGKPILITPLKKNEIKDLTDIVISDDIFYSIKSAAYSANRATLKVWGIDNIVTEIKEKLGI
jgi:hypothetical protein